MSSEARSNDGTTTINADLLLPFLLGLTMNQETQQNHQRVMLVNPITQNMVIISTDSNNNNSFESFFDELTKKGQPPASKAAIEGLPVVEIDKEKDEQCSVCLEEWKECEKGVEMPCKHTFHKGCVEKWLNIHGTCPVCRFQLPVEEKTTAVNDGHEDGEIIREIWVWLTSGERRTRTSQDQDLETVD